MSRNTILEKIEQFDSMGIQIVFLATPVRSGVTLLQSLLDKHPQILTYPRKLSYLNECITRFPDSAVSASEAKTLMNNFLASVEGRVRIVGRDGRIETVFLHKHRIVALIDQVLPLLSEIDPRKLFLLFHFAYAQVHEIDLSRIKVILVHEHLTPGPKRVYDGPLTEAQEATGIWKTHYTRSLRKYSQEGDPFLMKGLRWFPDARVLLTIRDPMAALFSSSQLAGCENLEKFYAGRFRALLRIYWACAMKRYLGDTIAFLKFEDLHLNLQPTMQALAKDLGIDFSETMLEPTWGGRYWVYPEMGPNGVTLEATIGPERLLKDQKWKTEWDALTIQVFYALARPLYDFFNYPTPQINGQDLELTADPQLLAKPYVAIEQLLMRQYTVHLSPEQLTELEKTQWTITAETEPCHFIAARKTIAVRNPFIQQRHYWSQYPHMRQQTVQYLLQGASDLKQVAEPNASRPQMPQKQ